MNVLQTHPWWKNEIYFCLIDVKFACLYISIAVLTSKYGIEPQMPSFQIRHSNTVRSWRIVNSPAGISKKNEFNLIPRRPRAMGFSGREFSFSREVRLYYFNNQKVYIYSPRDTGPPLEPNSTLDKAEMKNCINKNHVEMQKCRLCKEACAAATWEFFAWKKHA